MKLDSSLFLAALDIAAVDHSTRRTSKPSGTAAIGAAAWTTRV